MTVDDPFAPGDLTEAERNAKALARTDLQMLAALVQMRRDKGLTQETVAASLGRDKSSVSRFERLDSDPRMSTVRRYARAVGALITHDVSDFAETEKRPQPLAAVYAITTEMPPRSVFAEAVATRYVSAS
ncbi:helix-turn-helix domain-containing protein [Mycobacterium sp. SA01]|uniref:helix-turn-helix domain-containing protein n=1 Tax=Mycobacterium sp. SA01 TaxID=3238820 RepID=UPI00351B56B5